MRIAFVGAVCAGDCGAGDRPAKTSCSDDYMFGRDVPAAGNYTGTRFVFMEQDIDWAVGPNFGTVLFCGCEYRLDEQARIYRCFFGQPGDRASARAKRPFLLPRFSRRQRLGGESHAMKFSDHFIASDFSLGAAEHFEGAVALEIRGFAGSLLDCRDEFGIETQAFSAEWNQRRSLRRIRTRRQHSGSGPGSFAARLLAIEHRHAQFFGGKLEGDRATDQSSANDDYVVSAHRFILSGIAV